MAQAGNRVILVDTDLRRPSLAKLFSLDASRGFTTVLLNREDRGRALEEALQPTMVPQLWVMTSGPLPPNPAELLASKSMIALLRDLEARSDLVIFDSPPLGALTDAVVLSARVSGTLLLVRASSTRRSLVTNSIDLVRKVNGTVLGTVLNMVDLKAISNYSYYYYYQAGYYGYGKAETHHLDAADHNGFCSAGNGQGTPGELRADPAAVGAGGRQYLAEHPDGAWGYATGSGRPVPSRCARSDTARDANCSLCGATFRAASHREKYCPSCRPEAARQYQREWKRRRRAPEDGHAPDNGHAPVDGHSPDDGRAPIDGHTPVDG
jgi:capsular exopolysaccharide synthesis family protein